MIATPWPLSMKRDLKVFMAFMGPGCVGLGKNLGPPSRITLRVVCCVLKAELWRIATRVIRGTTLCRDLDTPPSGKEKMRVVGLDVCKSRVAVCVLDDIPLDVSKHYRDTDRIYLPANTQGIRDLLGLGAVLAIMEPTGINYSRLWGTHLARAGVEVRLVDHGALKSYRRGLRLPLKDDHADALALAHYGLTYADQPKLFVQARTPSIVAIRKLILRLAHLNRVQSPIVNRVRQDLAWQFPEVALVKSIRLDVLDPDGESIPPLLWGWLAGSRASKRYDRLLKESVGLGITPEVRLHAARLCDLQLEEGRIERELDTLLSAPEFESYRAVFHDFGFGRRIEAALLSQIYPIDSYLQGGAVIRDKKRHNLSLRRFRSSLGLTPHDNSSGDKTGRIVGGSDLCRKAMWQWVFTRVEVKRQRSGNPHREALGKTLDDAKAGGVPIRLARGRCAGAAVPRLFNALVKNCSF